MPNYWDDELSVLSTENVHFAVNTAGLGSRFMAVFIDLVIQLLLMLGVSLLSAYYMEFLTTTFGSQSWFSSFMTAIMIFLFFVILYAYFFFFEWLWHGLTPGKRLVGLRVLQANGLPATFWQVLVRNVLRIADFLPFFYGAGALAVIINDQNRRIGDQIAGTVVARERREEAASKVLDIASAAEAFLADSKRLAAPELLAEQTANSRLIASSESNTQTQSVALRVRIPEEQYEMVRDFLLRRHTLQPSARARLGNLLSHRIATLMDEPVPPEAQSESYLEYVAKHYEM
jgi:uncharacterized RDD family membrane protein YckC